MLLRALEDGVQPPVAAKPGERPLNDPADSSGNELSVSAARDGLDGDTESLTGLGQASAPVAEIAERRAWQRGKGQRARHVDGGEAEPRGEQAVEDAFAQALRAVGEPVIGRRARDVSMGRLLAQLFEITALFDMRLRPELVLLQKTMVVTEGVARRLWPDHDIWGAADPVVRRYILCELAPPARLMRLAEAGLRYAEALVQRLEAPAAVAVHEIEREEQRLASRFTWFAVGAALAGIAFLITSLLHH